MTEEEKIRDAKRDYHRQWRKKNPEKVRAAQERFWRRKLEEKKSVFPAIPEDAEIR